MQKSLDLKLAALQKDPDDRAFILADAKDADMAFGIAAPGRGHHGRLRSLTEFRDQIREIVRQGLIDIALMSASTAEMLAAEERLFDNSAVTPAARANDATDIHIVRGSVYPEAPSRPFATATIDDIQLRDDEGTGAIQGANLGLYSLTFNNHPERDLETLLAYKAFRADAESKGFRHFLEVFPPNVPADVHRIPAEEIPFFMNDHIVRLLAGVPKRSRPLFLKIPYQGPKALEELRAYDESLVIGILGGSAGTAHDAFRLIHEGKKYGARVALFGRKINCAEHQLSFVEHLRLVADDAMDPAEAVRSYHATLEKFSIQPVRCIEDDLALTSTAHSYA